MRLAITYDGDWFFAEMSEEEVSREILIGAIWRLPYKYDDNIPSFQADTTLNENRIYNRYAIENQP